jgi:uncharacterized protein (TIGR01244 family)
MKRLLVAASCISLLGAAVAARQAPKTAQIEAALREDIPRVLCIDENFATGAQPKDNAFAKLSSNGFKSVLNLRTANEGVDLPHEQSLVEKAGMRYINIPVVGSSPKPEQAEEFIKVVSDKANHPMLIHCASANRVGAFWMIYRVLEQGWTEEKALEEATRIGLTSPGLKKFAHDYIAEHGKGGLK